MRSLYALAVAALAVTLVCAAEVEHPWKADFKVPDPLTHGKFALVPMHPDIAPLDHKATQENRAHLLATLGWDYPEDYSVDQNKEDLQEYAHQYGNRSAYAYSIQTPDKTKAIGALFCNRPDFGEATEPVPEEANKEWPAGARSMETSLWLGKAETDAGLDKDVLTAITDWLHAKWPVDVMMLTVNGNNTKLQKLAEAHGMEQHQIHPAAEADETAAMDKVYAWKKPGFSVDLKALKDVEYPEEPEDESEGEHGEDGESAEGDDGEGDAETEELGEEHMEAGEDGELGEEGEEHGDEEHGEEHGEDGEHGEEGGDEPSDEEQKAEDL
jgi:RimJ/RimL family protein N-acetyltransferase